MRFSFEAKSAADFPPRGKFKSAQPSGLALIESLYFGAGARAAQDQLQRLLGQDQSLRPFSLSDTGLPSVGMDIVPSDEISYQSFSPPAAWNATYSLPKVRFGAVEKQEYVFHPRGRASHSRRGRGRISLLLVSWRQNARARAAYAAHPGGKHSAH